MPDFNDDSHLDVWHPGLMESQPGSDPDALPPDFSFWAEVGAPPPADEEDGPTVDEQSLLSLYRGELPALDAKEVYARILTYRAWREAYANVLGRLARAPQN